VPRLVGGSGHRCSYVAHSGVDVTVVAASRLAASYRATRIWESRQPGDDIGSFTMLRFSDPCDPTPTSAASPVPRCQIDHRSSTTPTQPDRTGATLFGKADWQERRGTFRRQGYAAGLAGSSSCRKGCNCRSRSDNAKDWRSSAGDSRRRPSDQPTNLVFLSRRNFPMPVCVGIEPATSPL